VSTTEVQAVQFPQACRGEHRGITLPKMDSPDKAVLNWGADRL
jgi:hypothetical protein